MIVLEIRRSCPPRRTTIKADLTDTIASAGRVQSVVIKIEYWRAAIGCRLEFQAIDIIAKIVEEHIVE
jgi:hypothetical protein